MSRVNPYTKVKNDATNKEMVSWVRHTYMSRNKLFGSKLAQISQRKCCLFHLSSGPC